MPTISSIAFMIALAAILPVASFGQETHTVLGPGAISCGEFLKDNDRMKSDDLFWVEGFLTGANTFSDVRHAGKDTDNEGRKLWLVNYCQANPLSHLTDATLAMRDEMIGKNSPQP